MYNFGKQIFYGTYAGDGENRGEDTISKLSGEFHHLQTAEECSWPPPSVVSNADQQKAERKRKADKAYRERCKRKKDEMTQELATLGKENEDLRTENQFLKEKNALQNQSLQSQAAELNQITNNIVNLKREIEKQDTLIQILSDRLVNPDLCLQSKKLRGENGRLRETAKLSDEALKLVEENVKLHHEKLLLEVKIDALLGQIVYETSKKCVHK